VYFYTIIPEFYYVQVLLLLRQPHILTTPMFVLLVPNPFTNFRHHAKYPTVKHRDADEKASFNSGSGYRVLYNSIYYIRPYGLADVALHKDVRIQQLRQK